MSVKTQLLKIAGQLDALKIKTGDVFSATGDKHGLPRCHLAPEALAALIMSCEIPLSKIKKELSDKCEHISVVHVGIEWRSVVLFEFRDQFLRECQKRKLLPAPSLQAPPHVKRLPVERPLFALEDRSQS